jgi:hypothetical protein
MIFPSGVTHILFCSLRIILIIALEFHSGLSKCNLSNEICINCLYFCYNEIYFVQDYRLHQKYLRSAHSGPDGP